MLSQRSAVPYLGLPYHRREVDLWEVWSLTLITQERLHETHPSNGTI
jgi:hypothetical protein